MTKPIGAAPWLLTALVLLAMGLRLHALDASSLWLDEILTAERVQLDLGSLISLLASGEGGTGATQTPLTYVTTYLFTSLMGHNEFILRLQAVLFGALSVLLIYRLGGMFWSSEVALLAAFLLAVNPHHVNMSQEARHYGLLVFLSLLSLIFLLRALERGRLLDWLGFVLCTSLSLYTHFFALLLLAAQVFFASLIISGRWLRYIRSKGAGSPLRQTLSLVVSLVLIGVSYIPWMSTLALLISRQGGSGLMSVSASTMQSSLDFLRSVARDYSGSKGTGLAVWVLLLLLGLTTSTRRQLALALSVLVIPFLFVASTDPQHKYHAKYVIFILPICLLVIAKGALGIVHLATRIFQPVAKNISAVTAALILLLFSVLAVERLSSHYQSQNTDWRSAARFLSERVQPGDILLAEGNGYTLPDHQRVERCLPYYLGRRGVGATGVLPIQRGLWDALEDDPARSNASVWAVVYHRKEQLLRRVPTQLRVVDLHHVAVIGLRQPSGETRNDIVQLLRHLVEVLPATEAHFDIHLALAQFDLAQGRDAKAAGQVERAKAAMPDDAKAERTLSRAYFELAAYYEESGDLVQAKGLYEEALTANPASERARRELEKLSPRDTFPRFPDLLPIGPLRQDAHP